MAKPNTVINTETRHRYVLRLREFTGDHLNQAGSKAANLAKLLLAGFPVPDGFVVTADAFEEFINSLNGKGDNLPEALEAATLSHSIRTELVLAIASLGDFPVAVRSSGVAEDLPGASFAGQYETFLDVRGTEAIIAAVQRCWASAFNKRVSAYRNAQGLSGELRMAVLVQQMVPADAAGVAFTANPVTGDWTETLVSAVRGLGERLVSGQASPDEWTIKNSKAVCQHATEQAIDSASALEIAALARRVEKHFGSPQDIEWAIAGGKLYLLQARPITTLNDKSETPVGVAADPPPGFWEREITHFPRVLSPMLSSFFLPIENMAFKKLFDEASPLLETIELKEIGGWVYQRMVPLGGKDRPAPPVWLMWLMVRVIPQMRSRVKGSVKAMRSDLFGSHIDRWYRESKPKLIARIGELRQINLASLSDEALDQHLTAVATFVKECAEIHFRQNSLPTLMLTELFFACRDLLGWDDRQTTDLLVGLSEKSSEPARRLAQLASMARRPAVSHLLENINDQTVKRLPEVDKEFATAFADYQSEFGLRALRYEIIDPTLAETPTLILGLVRDQLARGYDPAADALALEKKRATAAAEARAALAGRPLAERERFEKALARAEKAYPVREDNEFYTVSCPFALFRYALLEVGNRLVKHRQIVLRDDVFFLKLEEAQASLRNQQDRRGLVEGRKTEKAWIEAHPGPASYGKPPGPPPSLSVLPSEARIMMEAFLWALDRVMPSVSEVTQANKTTLAGIAASPGQYIGPARVVMNESEFHKVKAGDVLVCPITSPVWSVLFPSIGAVVTDTGGILCHSAIIAREYRIPAVVATGNATSILHDGQQVTVDGNTGLVKIEA